MISTKAILRLMAIALIMFLVLNLRATAMAEERQLREELAPCYVIKTKEEIALDLLRDAMKNIKTLKIECSNYNAFLEAYRKALNVVINPAKPVPSAKEGQ